MPVNKLKPKEITLANGANNDVILGDGEFIRIIGPTGVFNITGLKGQGKAGQRIVLYNTTAFAMTITDASTGSAVGNRIATLGNAAVTTGVGAVTLVYDNVDAQWVLTGFNA